MAKVRNRCTWWIWRNRASCFGKGGRVDVNGDGDGGRIEANYECGGIEANFDGNSEGIESNCDGEDGEI